MTASPSASGLEPLLTTEELAAILSVDPKTVRALIHEGHLPSVRIGRRCLRFDRRDVAAFIEGAKERRACAPVALAGRVSIRKKRGASDVVPLSERTDLNPSRRPFKGGK